MATGKSWLKETKSAVEITLKRRDYEHNLSAEDICKHLPHNTKEKKVFEVAFVLHTIDDDVIIWIIQILRICMKYIDSVWIMLQQPPYSLLRANTNALQINRIDSDLIIQLFDTLNECSVKYRLCLQAMDFSKFNISSYHDINKSILQLLSISNRKKSIFFVPVLSKNWIDFYKQNKNEFNDLIHKLTKCEMINSFGVWMRNEFINKQDIHQYIIPIIKAMALNQNVSFLMFRFDLMMMDNNNSNDNDVLFDAIASCLLNKKLSFTNNTMVPFWKNASRIPDYLSNSCKDSAVSLSFRVDKFFRRDFLYGNDHKMYKLLDAINKNSAICCNRMAISRGDIVISGTVFEGISNVIRNHKVHSLEQIIIDGYIDMEMVCTHNMDKKVFAEFVEVLIDETSQMKNISLHTVQIAKTLSNGAIPHSMIKLIQFSNKMMNYIGISMNAFSDELAYRIIDAYICRIYRMYESQMGIMNYFQNVMNQVLPFDILWEIIDFCKMHSYVVSIQIKAEIIKEFDTQFEWYRTYFVQYFTKLFHTNHDHQDVQHIYSMIAMNEVALYIGQKVNMHEFTQDDLWKISP